MAKKLGIEDIPRKLRAFKESKVTEETQAFTENLKMVKQTHLFIKKCNDAFLFLLYSQSFHKLKAQVVQRIQSLGFHARLLINQFVEEFRRAEIEFRFRERAARVEAERTHLGMPEAAYPSGRLQLPKK